MGRPADETSGEAHGEFALIARHFTRPPRDRSVRVGVGDDAAVVASSPGCELVLAVDMMVEGRHFLPGADPETLGHKILAVNLSDLAAMGARPRWALLALALPDEDDAWLAAFSRGLFALAAEHGVDLVGGDTTRGPRNLCLTIAGEVPAGAAILRGGARAGDDLWVSGTLGDAMLGLAALEGRTTLDGAARAACVARLERPSPRVALGTALRGVASAMLDVSDGLTGDVAHLLETSKAGAVVELAALPRSAALDRKLAGAERSLALQCLLAGGDDYELVFSASPTVRERVAAAGRDTGVPVARIGRIVAKEGLVVNDEQGAAMAALPRAFDHFEARRP
ncbi:MAG: thiamine-phosphate kinase [Betaproteobacteria bacterium]|nr:thiamine-phosphate kinase [Betaproteobacteria bacterium]